MRWTLPLVIALAGCPGDPAPVDTDTVDAVDTDVADTDTSDSPPDSGETGAPDTSTGTPSRALQADWCAAAGVTTDGTYRLESCLAPARVVTGTTGDGVYVLTSGTDIQREP